jgi:hypothetical protein
MKIESIVVILFKFDVFKKAEKRLKKQERNLCVFLIRKILWGLIAQLLMAVLGWAEEK